MDLMGTIMGASALTIGIVLVIMIAIGWDWIKLNLSKQTKSIAKVLAVVTAVALAFNMGFLAIDTGTTPEGILVAGPASWAAVATSSTNNTTVSGNSILTTYTLVAGEFDDSFLAVSDVTGSVTISFACTRTDTSIADAVASAYVVSVPTVTNTTSGITHDLCDKDALGVFDADFTVDSVASAMSATFPGDADDRTETVSLTIVFNDAAVEALAQYATISIQYNIGGVVFTHSIMHMD